MAELTRLGELEAEALRRLWPDWFGRPAPARMRRDLLALALAHRMQCETLGGLSKASARILEAVAVHEIGENAKRAALPPRLHRPGTLLVREWRGVVHEVTVVADGFLWNGARHRSLSAIARAITGVRWNGLVFFGLKSASSGSTVVAQAGRPQKREAPSEVPDV
jgi:hypothetical protein